MQFATHTQLDRRRLLGALMSAPLAAAWPRLAHAAVSAEDAARLKTTLTPFGAERAGNADGTIPAWSGGYTQVPAGYQPGDARPDPFEADAALMRITAQDADKHAALLTPGVMAMFKRFADYRIDVYPTRRSAAAPQYVYDQTFANATRSRAAQDGLVVENVFGGIPFPLPKTAREVMWNYLLSWQGESIELRARTTVTSADGRRAVATGQESVIEFPYYYKDGSLEKFDKIGRLSTTLITEPPLRAGEVLLVRGKLDAAIEDPQVWQYSPGQRRVRKAPNLSYDAPNFVASGVNNFDEIFLFAGPMDRYDWKLLGKKELIVPYNCNRTQQGSLDSVHGKFFINPDKLRWERHRVWVIEATLAQGKRNVVSRRTYYVDEDSWQIVLGEGYDGKGELWKLYQGLPLLLFDLPAVAVLPYAVHNLQTGAWMLDSAFNEQRMQWKPVPRKAASYFTPENLSSLGVR
jgi:hypothetical protein